MTNPPPARDGGFRGSTLFPRRRIRTPRGSWGPSSRDGTGRFILSGLQRRARKGSSVGTPESASSGALPLLEAKTVKGDPNALILSFDINGVRRPSRLKEVFNSIRALQGKPITPQQLLALLAALAEQ